MNKNIILFLVFAVALILLDGDNFAQCPMCKAGVESNAEEGATHLPAALNTGIMYLFVLPYLLIGGVAFFWYRAYKRSKHHRAVGKEDSGKIDRSQI